MADITSVYAVRASVYPKLDRIGRVRALRLALFGVAVGNAVAVAAPSLTVLVLLHGHLLVLFIAGAASACTAGVGRSQAPTGGCLDTGSFTDRSFHRPVRRG